MIDERLPVISKTATFFSKFKSFVLLDFLLVMFGVILVLYLSDYNEKLLTFYADMTNEIMV